MEKTADCSQKHSLSVPEKFRVCYASVSEPIIDKQTDRQTKKIFNFIIYYAPSKYSNELGNKHSNFNYMYVFH